MNDFTQKTKYILHVIPMNHLSAEVSKFHQAAATTKANLKYSSATYKVYYPSLCNKCEVVGKITYGCLICYDTNIIE